MFFEIYSYSGNFIGTTKSTKSGKSLFPWLPWTLLTVILYVRFYAYFCLLILTRAMKSKSIRYYGAALLAMFFWSFSFVWFKIAYLAYQPMTVILFRLFFATTLLFAFAKFTGKLQSVKRKIVFINLIPVFVAILAFFILGDRLSLQNMIGIGITIAGLFLAQIKKRKRKNGEYPVYQA